jgi:hypothetical protein
MATATSPKQKSKSPLSSMSLAQKLRYGGMAIAGVMLLWLVLSFGEIRGQARLGASYAAHVACSCRYIEGRPLSSCYKDFEPGMGLVSLTDDPPARRVTASVPLLAHAAAERRGDFGCIQLNEKELESLD